MSGYALVSLTFSYTALFCREAGSSVLFFPWWLMDPIGFQRELGEMLEILLHGSPETLVMSWNQRAVRTLDRIAPMWLFLTHCSWLFPWFTEELWVWKRIIFKWLESHWRKTKYDSDQAQLRIDIKAYLLVVRTAKQQYFSTFIASADCCPVALFWINWSLLGQGNLFEHLQGWTKEFIQHLTDKVTWIYSQLDPICGVGLCENPR